MISYFWGEREVLFVNQNLGEGESLVSIFNSSDTSSEACQMNRRRILLILLNRCQRFDSDAHHLTLKDTDQKLYSNYFEKVTKVGSESRVILK